MRWAGRNPAHRRRRLTCGPSDWYGATRQVDACAGLTRSGDGARVRCSPPKDLDLAKGVPRLAAPQQQNRPSVKKSPVSITSASPTGNTILRPPPVWKIEPN